MRGYMCRMDLFWREEEKVAGHDAAADAAADAVADAASDAAAAVPTHSGGASTTVAATRIQVKQVILLRLSYFCCCRCCYC